jgi:predicted HicB family RNase H-like nuclease
LPELGEIHAEFLRSRGRDFRTRYRRRAPTGHEAIAAIEQAVDEHLRDMQSSGEKVAAPLTGRNLSGTFVVRTSRALHTRLALEAAEQRVSMNHWVVQKLADRQLGSGLDVFGLD